MEEDENMKHFLRKSTATETGKKTHALIKNNERK
jgi:hypothetical protein